MRAVCAVRDRFVDGLERSGVLKRNSSSFGDVSTGSDFIFTDPRVSTTAPAAKAGLSQQMISFVERGTRNPTLDTLLRISQALEIPLGKIITTAEQKG